ncbi:MAG: hypothetical protein AB7E67_04565 [Xanthobacteraceae bacterium]
MRARELDPVSDPVCCKYCPDLSDSVRCHRHCASAAIRLSTDSRYPIEPLVAPLTFELKRLGAFHPCWSCEGHNDAAGRLNKKPALWFYVESVVHIRALAGALSCCLADCADLCRHCAANRAVGKRGVDRARRAV